jgi:hypothetical protein
VNGALRLANQQRLRELQAEHRQDLRIFCAHDPLELAHMQALSREAAQRPISSAA